MEAQWKQANEEINQYLEEGKAIEAFEKYYAESVIMQENETAPRVGKPVNREQCSRFVQMFPDLNLTILSTTYGEHISIQEVLFDYTNEEGEKINYTEVAVRHWKEGMVVRVSGKR